MDLAMVDAEKTLFPKDGKTNPAVQNDTTYGVRGELGELTIDRSSTEVPDLAQPSKSTIKDTIRVRHLNNLTNLVGLADSVHFVRYTNVLRGIGRPELDRKYYSAIVYVNFRGFLEEMFRTQQEGGNQGFIRHMPGDPASIPGVLIEKYKTEAEDTPDLLLNRAAATSVVAAALVLRTVVDNPVMVSRKVRKNEKLGIAHSTVDPYPIKSNIRQKATAVIAAARTKM